MTRGAISRLLVVFLCCLGILVPAWAAPASSNNSTPTALLVRIASSTDIAQLTTKYGLSLLSSAPGLGDNSTTLYLFQTPAGVSLGKIASALNKEPGVVNVESNAGFQLPTTVPLDPDVSAALDQSTV